MDGLQNEAGKELAATKEPALPQTRLKQVCKAKPTNLLPSNTPHTSSHCKSGSFEERALLHHDHKQHAQRVCKSHSRNHALSCEVAFKLVTIISYQNFRRASKDKTNEAMAWNTGAVRVPSYRGPEGGPVRCVPLSPFLSQMTSSRAEQQQSKQHLTRKREERA